MKQLKKMLALVLAVAMVMAMGVGVMAAPGDFTGEVETSINASGLTAGDTVQVYQLVKWDATTNNWALNQECGVVLANLIDGITEEEATTIAGSTLSLLTTLTVGEDGKVSYDCSNNPGLFYLKGIPGENNKDTVYNPAFVSADYYEGGNTVDFSDTIGNSTVIKKSTVPFDKEVTGADQFVDVKPGDVIPYKITTIIPSYGTSFTNPQFIISDTLSTGLALEGAITVKYGTTTITASDDNVTITPNGTSGFTVTFAKDYLTGLAGTTPAVEVTYSAKVTTEATENVTYMDNKAKLTFSNTPTTTKEQEDITRHYTFSIDSTLNGGNHGNEKTRELIKIGVDEAGETITAFTSWVEGKEWTTYSPLAGATFTLTPVAPTTGQAKTYTTEAEGYITFTGLDAGTYKLVETEAPAGYVKDSSEHTVIITPTYTQGTDILESYTVSIDGATSTYTITNMSDTDATVETTVDATSMTFPVVNTKGSELPTTGGIGTTIFYIIGAILVIGAGILLVARRRTNAE